MSENEEDINPNKKPRKEAHINLNNFPYLNLLPDRPNPTNKSLPTMDRKQIYSHKDIQFSPDGLTVKSNTDYIITLSNYGITTGTYYYEVRILDLPEGANVRLGIAQVSCPKDTPLGFDGFSYSFRADPPTLFHRSRPYDVDKGYMEGDVVGVLLHLPPLNPTQKKELKYRRLDQISGSRYYSYEVKHDLPSIINPMLVPCGHEGQYQSYPKPFPPQLPYEFEDPFLKFDQLPLFPSSQLAFFINGQQISSSFMNLYLAKYHPAVSLYNGARVKFNFGPSFDFEPPKDYDIVMCPTAKKLDLTKFGIRSWEDSPIPFVAIINEDEFEDDEVE